MTTAAKRYVVVGVDGSAEADAALRFALTEAQLRRLPLHVVCAWEPSTSSYVGEAFAATPDAFLEAEHLAEEVAPGRDRRDLTGRRADRGDRDRRPTGGRSGGAGRRCRTPRRRVPRAWHREAAPARVGQHGGRPSRALPGRDRPAAARRQLTGRQIEPSVGGGGPRGRRSERVGLRGEVTYRPAPS